MDFDDLFSVNNNQYQQNQGCDSAFNDFLSLQSPISMPSVDPPNLDMPSGCIGTSDYYSNPSSSSKSMSQSAEPQKNRISDFSDPSYDFSFNFMNQPISQPRPKKKIRQTKSLPPQVPVPQISAGPGPSPKSVAEPQCNLTLNDILNNFTLMQQQQQMSIPQQKQIIPFKKRIPYSAKKTLHPFVSIESCEFAVDRLRSFIETHKRRAVNRF